MGLLIYSNPNPGAAFSIDGLFTNPLVSAFNGAIGDTTNKRYYVRNDAANRSYESITFQPVYDSGDNIISGTNGFGWKLIVGDTQPLEEQWDLVSFGNSIVIPNIGTSIVADLSTYEPFWLRIVVPRGASVKSHVGIKLRLSYTEILVP
jgi:hypothetical protein